jgi:hypothetical protein
VNLLEEVEERSKMTRLSLKKKKKVWLLLENTLLWKKMAVIRPTAWLLQRTSESCWWPEGWRCRGSGERQ